MPAPGRQLHLPHPRLLLMLGALLPLAFYTLGEVRLAGGLGFPLDDSWIHLQFARNLAAGDGLSYNPGELVTGSTAPLWTALLSLLFLVPGGPVVWVKLAGAVLHLGVVAATYRLGRELDLSRGLAALAGALVAGSYWLVWSALSGMEVALFTFLSLGGTILHLRERREPGRPPISLGVFGVAALARPEGVLLLLLAAADRCLTVRRDAASGDEVRLVPPAWRPLLAGLGLATLALVPAALFYAAVGGSPLPTTFGAKTAAPRFWPNHQYLYLVLGIFFKPQPYAVLLAGGGVVRLVRRLGSASDRGLLPALWALGLPVAYSFLTPLGRHLLVGNFGRYYFPLLPVVVVLGVLGLEGASQALGRFWRLGSVRLPVRIVLLALLVLPTLTTLGNNASFYARNVANVQDSDVAMGLWARANLPPDAVLAVQDIGAIKFFAPQRILDLVGLVSPEIQAAIRETTGPRDPMGERGVMRFLEEKRPDFLLAYPSWHPSITSDRSRFLPIHRLEIPDNITMAGPEMVVYVTPWNRYRPRTGEAPAASKEPAKPADEERGAQRG